MRLYPSWRRPFWLGALLLLIALGLILTACAPQGIGANPTSTTAALGTLTGDVVAGPTCPVQQAETPCPPKPVPDHQVTIKTPNGTVVATATTDAQGHFSVSVAPGDYLVEVSTGPGLGLRQTQPVQVTVVAGQSAYVKIELDTGIR